MNHRHTDAVAQKVDVAVEAGLPIFGHGDVKRGAAHVDGNHVINAKRLGDEQTGLWCRSWARVNRIHGAFAHHLTNSQATIGLEVTHWLLRAQAFEVVVDFGNVSAHDWA